MTSLQSEFAPTTSLSPAPAPIVTYNLLPVPPDKPPPIPPGTPTPPSLLPGSRMPRRSWTLGGGLQALHDTLTQKSAPVSSSIPSPPPLPGIPGIIVVFYHGGVHHLNRACKRQLDRNH